MEFEYIYLYRIISPSLIQNRYFLTEQAFDECISICASGQNPSGLEYLGPHSGTCIDNEGCPANEFCEREMHSGHWGFCIRCDQPGLYCGWYDGADGCVARCECKLY